MHLVNESVKHRKSTIYTSLLYTITLEKLDFKLKNVFFSEKTQYYMNVNI